jgi:ribonucleotide monophosphatase NagD (HAD superfamily)
MKSSQVQKVSDVPKFLDSFDTFLLDCDGRFHHAAQLSDSSHTSFHFPPNSAGVLWRGSTLLPHTKEVLQQLRSMVHPAYYY